MKRILVFSSSSGTARAEMICGVREFAHETDWNIQTFDFGGEPFPVRDLIRFWSPVGCIVEVSGNGLKRESIPRRAFGKTPVVYIGGDSHVVPANATCVVHDAKATGEYAARELLAIGMKNFAFLGWKGREWSESRKQAFAAALRLNGRELDTFDLPPSGKEVHSCKRWLSRLPKPCGLFAANDAIAETALSICRIAGISVPDDIAVIGVDDDESICENSVPTLSSVRPDFRQGGRLAARLLARKILKSRYIRTKTVFTVSGTIRRSSTRIFKQKDADVSAAIERIWKPDGALLSPKEILSGFPCSRRNAEIRFRRTTGRSVLEEIMKARMHLAKRLLSETQLQIAIVAERCGYCSVAHFRDTFRTSTGCNPLEWRNSFSAACK